MKIVSIDNFLFVEMSLSYNKSLPLFYSSIQYDLTAPTEMNRGGCFIFSMHASYASRTTVSTLLSWVLAAAPLFTTDSVWPPVEVTMLLRAIRVSAGPVCVREVSV